jgi:DNA-binding MarR family transcriptional regulator
VTDLDGDVDRVLADSLARLIESAVSHTTALARARDLTPTDLRALGLVKRGGSMRPGELALALQLSASGTTSVIRRLVAAGLVHRDSGPANHRDVLLRAVGREAERLLVLSDSQVEAACDLLDLGASERELIAAFALRLVELIENDVEAMRVTATRAHVYAPAPPRWS